MSTCKRIYVKIRVGKELKSSRTCFCGHVPVTRTSPSSEPFLSLPLFLSRTISLSLYFVVPGDSVGRANSHGAVKRTLLYPHIGKRRGIKRAPHYRKFASFVASTDLHEFMLVIYRCTLLLQVMLYSWISWYYHDPWWRWFTTSPLKLPISNSVYNKWHC